MGHLRSFRGTGRILGESSFLTRRVASAALKTSMVGMMVFLLTFVFLPSITSAANALDATPVNMSVSWTPISLTFSDGGAVAFGSIAPRSASGSTYGTMKVVRKTLSATTNGKALDIYISMSGSETALKYGSDTTSSIQIPAIGPKTVESVEVGTWSNPVAFSGLGWGYAVPQKTVSGSVINTDSSFAGTTAFVGSFGLNDGTSSQVSGEINSDASGYNAQTWAGVPASNEPQKIWSQTTTNANGFGGTGSSAGDTDKNNFDVYYAAMVDTSIVSGTYGNSIVYTALASTDSLADVSNNIRVTNVTNANSLSTKRNTTALARYAANGDQLNLDLDMSQSDGTINSTNTKVYLVPHKDIDIGGSGTSATYAVSSTMLAAIENNEYPTCTGLNFTTVTSGMSITCNISGATVVSTLSNGENTDGFYDVWIRNEEYNVDYLSKYIQGSSVVATLAFVGLQSKASNGTSYVITNMQDMTSSVCSNTNMWGSGYGTAARVYDPTGTTKLADGEDSVATVQANSEIGVGTFELTDSRDSKKYLVRRLADGNCWMVQNLALELGDATATDGTTATISLNADNTDLNSDKYQVSGAEYDPGASLAAKVQTKTGSSQTGIQNQLAALLGSTQSCTSQFQPRLGSNPGTTCHWGSSLNENVGSSFEFSLGYTLQPLSSTLDSDNKPQNRSWIAKADGTSGGRNGTATQTGSIWVENNSLADIPRSYNNGSDWVINNPSGTTSAQTSALTAHTFNDNGDNVETQYIGNYYNWYAATAESGDFTNFTSTAQTAADSICPAGWQLPVDAQSGKSWYNLTVNEYQSKNTSTVSAINSAAGSTMLRSSPLSIIFSGYYHWVHGNLYNRGSSGSYWSSTPYSSVNARSLYFNSTNVNPQHNSNKPYGFTVRCVAR